MDGTYLFVLPPVVMCSSKSPRQMDPNRAAYEKYVKMGEDVPEAEQETEVLLPIVPITTEVK